MKVMRATTRLAWSFAALFVVGILLVAGFAYYEFVIEPVILPSEHYSIRHEITEVAIEASIPVALLCLGGWWLARKAMRPVEALAAAASRINEGNLREPITPQGDAEFVRLAEVFNSMTARLDDSFQRVRQFTLYASHELKTPLSVLHAEFERIVDDPERSEADRALFGRHLDEIVRLSRLVDGLTFLTRADSRLIPMAQEQVALHALVESASEDAAVLGSESEIEVTLKRCDVVECVGDRHRLRQLLVILCDNAIKYNRPKGSVTIELMKERDGFRLSIVNTGPGIPASDHARVFERFYRGANVKEEGIDGSGLGLSVAQWIAEAHHGKLSFHSELERTEFVFEGPCGVVV